MFSELTTEACFQSLVPILTRPVTRMNEGWKLRMARHVQEWHAAQAQMISLADNATVPSLERYIPARCGASGLKILLCLTEFVEDLRLEEVPKEMWQELNRMEEQASKFLALASVSRPFEHLPLPSLTVVEGCPCLQR